MKIAILSQGPGNYSTKRLKEEAEKRGHTVVIVNYSKCYLTVERGNPVVRYEGENLNDIDAIIPRIATNLTKYGTAIVRQFEMRGVFTTASSIAISRSRDKLRSYQVMAKNGIGVPKTVFARETADFEDVIEAVGGVPVIIKVARGTHGNGVVLAETKKAAKAVMQAFLVEGVSFLVQDFIEESEGTDIRVLVVGGEVVAAVKRQSLDDDFRSNTHQGGIAKPVRLDPAEEKAAIRAARSMGLPICGVDMLRSERGPLILEVNSSASLRAPETIAKKNVAKEVIEYIEENVPRKRKKDKVGA